MKPYVILMLIFLASPFCVNAQTITPESQFKQVQIMLSKADNLSGDFKQIQKIKILSTPLISTGHFFLSKKKGLQWHQTAPFKSRLIVTTSKIEQQLENQPSNIITKEQQPIIFSFTNIFLSVFKGETATIQEYFAISFHGNTAQWSIVLKPLGSPLNKAINSIEISGNKYIHSITIDEAKNNKMIISLYNVKEQQK